MKAVKSGKKKAAKRLIRSYKFKPERRKKGPIRRGKKPGLLKDELTK